ncbi:MAG: hypothetical protein H0U23_06075 [Blastocatellia bacterium]|nr:hypothetical protein [Blastocatellia bacterium]
MKRPSSPAFSLVELTIALGVAAVSLLAIVGLLATAAQTNHSATEQSASTDLLTAVAADLRATPSATSTSVQFGIAIPANPVGSPTATTLYFDTLGQSSTTLVGSSRYRVVATFLPNGGGRTATLASLRITWPAAADPTISTTGAAEIFVALDRN